MSAEIDWREIADSLAKALEFREFEAGEGLLSRPLREYYQAVKKDTRQPQHGADQPCVEAA